MLKSCNLARVSPGQQLAQTDNTVQPDLTTRASEVLLGAALPSTVSYTGLLVIQT